MADVLVPEDFRALAAPLMLEAPRAPAPIELFVESVQALPAHRLRAAPFSVVLRGPPAPLLAQATYALRHPRHGVIEVFLVPVARDAAGARYEATFN